MNNKDLLDYADIADMKEKWFVFFDEKNTEESFETIGDAIKYVMHHYSKEQFALIEIKKANIDKDGSIFMVLATDTAKRYLDGGMTLRSWQAVLMFENTTLAQMTSIPVETIEDYMTGKSKPGVEDALKICDAIGIDPNYIMF